MGHYDSCYEEEDRKARLVAAAEETKLYSRLHEWIKCDLDNNDLATVLTNIVTGVYK